jgi:hypothetical protein
MVGDRLGICTFTWSGNLLEKYLIGTEVIFNPVEVLNNQIRFTKEFSILLRK